MDKFSVIVPTIWRSEYTIELLKKYSECDLVGEIILIDNASDLGKTINFDKVLHIKEPTNIFVNPAWNKGVALSKFDNIVISNDDILYDVDYFLNHLKYAINVIDTNGFIGMASDNYNLENNLESPYIDLYGSKPHTGGWACLFFFKKQKWVNIPDTIKIYYGDNFIHMYGNPIYEFNGLSVKTKMSSSADTRIDWVKAITDNDTKEWNKLFK
jgi:GT2 family glycosyltransferase